MTAEQLSQQKCVPCEGGVPALSLAEVEDRLHSLPGWRLNGPRIRKEWIVKNFVEGVEFFERIGELAEVEGHHPDLHLVDYRNVAVEIWTHAIRGLSENDFILAAKIDKVPVRLKSSG